jgi:hypothetical protein
MAPLILSSSSSLHTPLGKAPTPLGTQVAKIFLVEETGEHEIFYGTLQDYYFVQETEDDVPFYHVFYDDGDSEDLTEEEVQDLLEEEKDLEKILAKLNATVADPDEEYEP